MDGLKSRLAGVVLAGGWSRRMGRDKATLTFGGLSLMARTLAALRPWTVELAVSARPGQPLPELPADVFVLRDSRPDEGPLRGLADAFARFAGRIEGIFLAPTDGLLGEDLLGRLVASFNEPAEACVPSFAGQLLPLPGIYALNLAPKANKLLTGSQRGLKHLLALGVVARVPIAAAAAAATLSLDTPAAFAAATTPRPTSPSTGGC